MDVVGSHTVASSSDMINALLRAKRTLRLLSDCNSALIHSLDEPELLAKVCRLIVDVGGYRLVWIGYAQEDTEKSVLPVAQFGFSPEYIANLKLTWADDTRGRGPTGRAIRLGQTQIARDIPHDPQFAPWRANAQAHGFNSSIALPLRKSGVVFGAVNIYSPDTDSFDQEEIQLLEELVGNLAYGIAALHLRDERNRALLLAQKQDRICRAVVEQSVDGIVIAWLDGRILMVNPAYCTMTGYVPKELEQRTLWGLTYSETESTSLSLTAEQAGNHHGVQELEVVRKDGSRFLAELRTYPIALSNGDGEERAILGVIVDITKHKQDEAEKKFFRRQALHNAQLASVGVMAAGIVHEVNNPNNAILFNCNLLTTAWKDIKIILREYYMENGDFSFGGLPFVEMSHFFPTLLDGIAEHATRIKNVINNMRHLSREGHGIMEENLNLSDVLKRSVTLMRGQIGQRTNHLLLTVTEPLPPMCGNQQQLEQVFINVITNALQATQDTEQAVHIAVAPTPGLDKLVVTVRDEGVGIAKEHHARLTEPFFSTKLAEGGSGLGLFISNKIVENHGGEMRFFSDPGQGTTVQIWFPVADGGCANQPQLNGAYS